MHMIEHELIMLVATLLLAASAPARSRLGASATAPPPLGGSWKSPLQACGGG